MCDCVVYNVVQLTARPFINIVQPTREVLCLRQFFCAYRGVFGNLLIEVTNPLLVAI